MASHPSIMPRYWGLVAIELKRNVGEGEERFVYGDEDTSSQPPRSEATGRTATGEYSKHLKCRTP
jgi:hypothetical protein